VSLFFGKHKLQRFTGRENGYVLDGTQFKAFRSEVPEQIKNLLRVDEINFQRQHESHFWFSKSPGEIAKELNALVDLESIDRVQAAINKRLRDAKAEYDIVHKNIAETRSRLAGLRWASRVWSQIDQLAGLFEPYRAKSHKLARISELADNGSRQLTRQRNALAGLSVAQTGQQTACRLAGLLNRLSRLNALYGAIRRSGARFSGRLPELSRLELIRRQLATVFDTLSTADDLTLAEAEADGLLKQTREQLTQELDGRCPTCGSTLSQSPF
jgi:hypothetical protein